jgi:hypothetical protein
MLVCCKLKQLLVIARQHGIGTNTNNGRMDVAALQLSANNVMVGVLSGVKDIRTAVCAILNLSQHPGFEFAFFYMLRRTGGL